jgi:hypothetical protein
LANTRHNLTDAQLTESQWRDRWEAERRFLAVDGESGKWYGNETVRVTPDGEVSIKLPAPLAHLANARHGRYVLAARVEFTHRGAEWRDRIDADRAVAYRIHLEVSRGRWYLTASWQRPVVATLPDAQIRHAITGLLHWATRCGVAAIGVENFDFTAEKTREKHGARKRFRRLISRFPRHRPCLTAVMAQGIGPSRPDRAPLDVTEPATLPQAAPLKARRRTGTVRGNRACPTPFGTRQCNCHSSSLLRNGIRFTARGRHGPDVDTETRRRRRVSTCGASSQGRGRSCRHEVKPPTF